MNWFNGIVVYVILWWLVFFCALPFGVRPAEEGDPGHDAGAPANPRLRLKVLATTAIATALFGIAYWFIVSDIYSFRSP